MKRLFGGEQGVTFAEMEAAPRLVAHPEYLEIWVWNSLQSSSLGIHQIRFRKEENTLVFTGFQTLVTSSSNPNRFTFSYEALGIDPLRLAEFAMVWQDPDGRTTALDSPQGGAPAD